MIKSERILVCHDFSDCSSGALDYGIELAAKTQAELHFLHVEVLHDEDRFPTGGPKTKGQILREKLSKDIHESVDRQGFIYSDIRVLTYTVLRDIAAAPAIVRYCNDYNIDLVILGTHGRRGLTRKLLGSVAEEVVRFAPCTVFTVRNKASHGSFEDHLKCIEVPVDFSSYSQEALCYAKELAASFNARLNLIHVIEDQLHPAFYNTGVLSVYDLDPDIDKRVLEALQKMYAETPEPHPEVQYTLLNGHPVKEIIQWCERGNSDLLIIATHGLSGFDRAIMGSVAERVVRKAPCPVITVKHPKPALEQSENESKIDTKAAA